ncbi:MULTISPECIES: hypothetical protein [Photorhabdus]|uniref:Uncharacterized protein n=2 Tax=Photorhabdus TaxID=29487 RepID=A0ABX0AYL6_9GAMM|nr:MULTISPECIES: hypothetical protein [Photorhabdus]MCC8463550.1 hypothetical protein [Photorhabdus bodei]MDB6366451.1 hypothetical protein [Photorhabdus bodei]MDB6373571.1 hypothetical protein [Photorhabdus bodei]NDL12169.1 hypothetical protein [Photorhabdus kayaii]NDL25695.1 hypothetical protein [Photorhabdus kayaii]
MKTTAQVYHIFNIIFYLYTLWISSCIATARERIPGSIDNYVTGVSECSQQRGSLKDDGYISILPVINQLRIKK